MRWPTCTLVEDCRCACIINEHNRLEKVSILIENVKVGRLGLQVQLRKTHTKKRQQKLQAWEKTQRWAGLLKRVARLKKRKRVHVQHGEWGNSGEKEWYVSGIFLTSIYAQDGMLKSKGKTEPCAKIQRWREELAGVFSSHTAAPHPQPLLPRSAGPLWCVPVSTGGYN